MSGRGGKSWETQACICIHVSTYAYIKICIHTEGKQNKTEQSIAHGPPPGRGRESKQAADVNRVTAPGAAAASARAGLGSHRAGGSRTPHGRRRPRGREVLEVQACSPPLASPQGEEVAGAKVVSERWP